MVWYVPPLSPIQSHAHAGSIDERGGLPDVESLRIPVRYLANLLTGGNEPPVTSALKRMLAMRAWFRARQLGEEQNPAMLEEVGLDADTAEEKIGRASCRERLVGEGGEVSCNDVD